MCACVHACVRARMRACVHECACAVAAVGLHCARAVVVVRPRGFCAVAVVLTRCGWVCAVH
eukprot:4825360-Alexandrium_andersonii.AAC.1